MKRTKGCMHCHRHMLVKKFKNIEKFLDYCQEHHYNLVAAELTKKSSNIVKVNYPESPIFVTGHEKTGVPEEILKKAKMVVKIPQVGLSNCLNTGVAMGIMVYDWFKKEVVE